MARITKEAKRENRLKLLEAAAIEFAEKGLEGANINHISKAAGFAKGTVYNYFDSKEALFLAVVEEGCRLTGSVPDDEDAPTIERLRALLAADIEGVRENEAFAKVVIREVAAARPEFYPQVVEAAAPYVDKATRIIEQGIARGEIRDDLPARQMALAMMGLSDMALISHWGSGSWPQLDEIPELVVELLVNGIAPRTAFE